MEGKKHDQDKPAAAFIPPRAALLLGDAFAVGQKKYGDWNYANGMPITKPLGGVLRHTWQFLAGETYDKEGSELLGRPVHHLACAAANALMALEILLIHGSRFDNRYKPEAGVLIRDEQGNETFLRDSLKRRYFGRDK